jgi:hypothetical protein
MVSVDQPVTTSEKQEALDLALNSRTLSRSAQLRSFLQYICEMDMAGRGQELTEYQVAVEVLGRRKDMATSDDSSVRNRAYELRQRLERLYASEAPQAPVRIEIPRGGYVPHYVRFKPVIPVEVVVVPQAVKRRFDYRLPGALAAALFCLAGGWQLGRWSAQPNRPAVLVDAWGPLAESGGELAICIATNLHLLVRPHIEPTRLRYRAPDELYHLFADSRPLNPGETLYMEPASLSIPLQDSVAAFTLAKTRESLGGSYQILPEAEAPLASLHGRNAIIIGTPVNSIAATVLLKNQPFNIGFTSGDELVVIDQRKPAGQNEAYVGHFLNAPAESTLYGLLTVIPGADAAGHPKRTVLVAGTGSAGVQAVAEFFSSPDRMRELKARFASAGLKDFPPEYQVVVRCRVMGGRLISFEYLTHAIRYTHTP